MAEEIKKEGEEVTPATPAPGEDKKTDPIIEDKGIDYVAELEKSKKQLTQAEYTIIELKKEKKEKKDDDEELPDLNEELQKIREEQKQELDKIKIDLVKDTVSDILSSLTSNQDERELIRFNYENRIKQSGFDRQSILDDLVSAQLLANKPKLEKTITELKRTLDSELGKNKGGSATGHNVDIKTTTLSSAEESWVKQHAMRTGIPEDKIKEKLIANKKIIS